MTKYEVVQKTLNFEETPYIPVCGACVPTDFLLDVTGEKEYTRYNAREIYFRAMKKLNCDIILQYVLPFPERFDNVPEASIQPTKHRFTESIILKPKHESGLQFNTPEDIRDYILTLPDPEKLERDFDFEENYLAWIELMQRRDEYMEDMAWLPGHIARVPNFMLYSYFGYEPYLMALGIHKPEMKKLFEISGEESRLRNMAIAQANKDKNFIDWAYLGMDICGKNGPMCSPKTLKEIYWPATKRALQPLKETGMKILWHCDGNIMPILDDLIDIGVDGLQGFEEEAGVDINELSEIKAKTGKRMVLFCGLSVTTTLLYGTIEDVKKKIELVVDLSRKRGGGIVLAPSSSILNGTPNKNIYVHFEYSKEYSKRIFATTQVLPQRY